MIIIIMGTVSFAVLISTDKPDIHEATYDDLCDIYGLGEVLSTRVVEYIEKHPECDIDDLTDVKGVGEYRLKLIKSKYK